MFASNTPRFHSRVTGCWPQQLLERFCCTCSEGGASELRRCWYCVRKAFTSVLPKQTVVIVDRGSYLTNGWHRHSTLLALPGAVPALVYQNRPNKVNESCQGMRQQVSVVLLSFCLTGSTSTIVDHFLCRMLNFNWPLPFLQHFLWACEAIFT